MASLPARAACAAGLLAIALAVAACGGGEEAAQEAPPAAGAVRFHDPEVGIAGEHPAGWHRARAITNLSMPREVVVLASYALRTGAKAGECAPDTAREDMPPNGVFVWLLEYRPLRGDVWADLPRERFPPKPDRFRLERGDLGGNNSCFPGPTYRTAFRAAGRPLDLLIAFGGPPADDRLDEVAEILTSLRFGELPAPPPDPYAGWPLVNDDSGDSLRPPPGWAASASRYTAGESRRPRSLFFASNRPLAGLPSALAEAAELPSPLPDSALADDFPEDAILLWVVEERREGGGGFPAIDAAWPGRDDFQPAAAPTEGPSDVRWLRARGAFRGYRLSVWIASRPRATKADRQLAFKSAASLALSGCRRDGIDDCADR